jgi:hypothetical protein
MNRQGLKEQNAGLGRIPYRASVPPKATQQQRHYAQPPNQQSSRQRDRHTHPPAADDYFSGYDIPRQASSARHYKPTNTQAVTKITEDVPGRTGLTLKGLLLAISLVLLAGSLLAFLFTAYAAPAIQNYSYTQNYGNPPRIYKVKANTGHGTKTNPESQYIGINNGGEIEVVELPTGTPTASEQPQLYDIAHLTGQEAANTPITDISFADINGDGKVDMEVEINNTLYVLYNTGKVFKPQQ